MAILRTATRTASLYAIVLSISRPSSLSKVAGFSSVVRTGTRSQVGVIQPCMRQATRFFASSSTDVDTKNNNNRLFPEELNVIYDSKCNVCKLEIDWLSRRDERLNTKTLRKLRMTDLESMDYNSNSEINGKVGYRQGMEAIHAVTPDGKVLKGVPVFRAAYEQVGLGWLFAITQWPILSSIVGLGYDIFAKYRTYITRGSSVDELVQIYEERQQLLKKPIDDDCEVCQTSTSK